MCTLNSELSEALSMKRSLFVSIGDRVIIQVLQDNPNYGKVVDHEPYGRGPAWTYSWSGLGGYR